MSAELVDAIAEMCDEEAVLLAGQLLDSGTPPNEILADCRKAMAIVCRRFEDEEYSVPELILAGGNAPDYLGSRYAGYAAESARSRSRSVPSHESSPA